MAKKLDRYRDKRDPKRTNEPFGAEPVRSVSTTPAGRFVVHLHDATREHYDLRIEVGGVLQSFAVPRGPSLRPADKHLAIHTEAHPLGYLDFEAVIPEGNYGAGPMILWDRGAIRFLEMSAEEGLSHGKLDFVLQGFKLRGRFALVKLAKKKQSSDQGKEWLLFKKRDAYARDDGDILVDEPRSVLSGLRIDELPRAVQIAKEIERDAESLGARKRTLHAKDLTPMRCSEDSGKLDDPDFLYELKLDGVRILAERNGDSASLRYRTQRNATASYPEVVRALQALATPRVILDGEIVTFDEHGRPSFALLTRRIQAHGGSDIRNVMRALPVVYLVFDVLAVGELDLRALPLHARKQLLTRIVPGKGVMRALDHVVGHGQVLLDFCEAQGLEGVIGKRADSKYDSTGARSKAWWKHKRVLQDDFVVVGFVRGVGSRKALGSLELASYAGDQLVTRGRVGSGLDAAAIAELQARFAGLEVDASPARGELMAAPSSRTFVAPRVVVSVEHAGFTPDGRLRHPVYRGIRDDVAPADCNAAPQEERELAQLARVAENGTRGGAIPGAHVTISNADKVFWPEQDITKGQLCEYYATIADTLLPYLRDRPVLMVRYPDGISGKHFFQWNAPAGVPDFVQTESLHSEEHGRDVTFLRVESLDALMYVANLGCIPLHVLAARFEDLDRCDFITIDFDLGESPLAFAVTLARSLHELLGDLELHGFPKTSGQTGLHVLIPVGGVGFEIARALVTLIGRILHERHPEISTMERSRSKRRAGTVYIDTGQTGRSRAIVAPYSVRAYPGATVSTPLEWDEVGQSLAPARFDIFAVPDRVAQHGDPMSTMLGAEPDLGPAMEKLEELVRLRPRAR